MNYKDSNYDFIHIFPKDIRGDFLFPLDTYSLFLERLSINHSAFYQKWSDVNVLSIIDKYWKPNQKSDWKWSLTFPLFSLLEKEGVANDINGYPKAPPSIRIWGGSTVQNSDIKALLHWIDWAYNSIKNNA